MKKLLVLFLIVSQLGYGEGCQKSVSYLKTNDPSPCTGYLFSPEKELEVRIKIQDYDFLLQEIALKDKQIDSLNKYNLNLESINASKDKQITLWQDKAVDSTEKLIASESSRGWRDAGFFALGILAVVLGAYAIKQVK